MPRLCMPEPSAEGMPAPSVEAEQYKTPRRKRRHSLVAAATPADSFEFEPHECYGDNYPPHAVLPTDPASTRPEAVPDPPAGIASTKTKCGECGQTLSTKNMARHRQVHSRGFADTHTWSCPSCSHYFRSSSALRRHTARIHTPPGNHQCTVCSKVYKTRENMLEHVRDVHKKSYASRVCPNCQRGFTRPWRYRGHMEASKCINKSGQALDFTRV